MSSVTARMVGETVELDVDAVTLRMDPDRARRLADSIHDAIEQDQPPKERSGDPGGEADPSNVDPSADDDDHRDRDNQPLYTSDSVNGSRWLTHPAPARVSENMRSAAREYADTVRFSVGVMRFMESAGVDPATVAEVVADPDHRWSMPNPRSQDLSEVAVRDDAPYGAVYYTNADGVAYVIAIRRTTHLYSDRRSITAGKRSSSKGAQRRRPTVDDLDSLIGFAESAGLRFTRGKGHGKVYDPQAPQRGYVTVPLTPSDSRSWLNCAAQIRRTFKLS